jgi:sugar O-acyltransferase (sialic acid O-acetyltransferase NeuD family)
MALEPLVIIGAGGLGREVAQYCQSIEPDRPFLHAVTRPEFLRPGEPDVLLSAIPRGTPFICAIGDPTTRRRITEQAQGLGLVPESLVHPSAVVSRDAQIGHGALICPGVIITTGVTVGHHVHLNLATTVAHDVALEDYVTTAPGVNISGHVRLKAGAYVGTGASIINGTPTEPLIIGSAAVVGAGACVVRAVADGTTVVGVPARELRPRPPDAV